MLLSYLRNYILPSITGRAMGAVLLLCALCVCCDHIDEDERLIYVKPAAVGRSVLIEDFTGQNCLNCPTATQIIGELQESYGHENVVAVAIHSGDFGYMRGDRNRPYPLTTDMGDAYFNHWGLSSQPVGIVNRQGASDYASWGTQVFEQLQKTARVDMRVQSAYDSEKRQIDVTVYTMGMDGNVSGKLQVWLTEDNITEGQRMPDGVWNREYTHNHVFRDAVNGAWGDDYSIQEGNVQTEKFFYTIPEDKDWKAENMHVVAFVYNDKGVEQVVSAPVVGSDGVMK